MDDKLLNPVAHSLTRSRLIQGMEPIPFVILALICGIGIYITFVRVLFGYLPIALFVGIFLLGAGVLRKLAERDPMFFQILLRRLTQKDAYTPYDFDGRPRK